MFTVPVTDAVVPPSLERAEVEITVLGVSETKTYDAAPGRSHTFTWSGKDAYGRAWPGETVAEVRVGLIYDGVYVRSDAADAVRVEFAEAHPPVTQELGPQPVPALEAKLTRPGELAEGPDGSLFVTLGAVNLVARIDRAGTIEIAVGGGTDAGESVAALKTELSRPRGLAVAADGAIFIAEAGRHRVRRVDPSGRVTTFAGSGEAGNTGDGGAATSASFRGPTALALDAEGALYVADQGNARIRRIISGTVQAFAGGGDRRGGPGAATRLASVAATGMVVSRDGTLYAINDDDHTVLAFSGAFPGASTADIVMPNEDGSQLFVFDGRGRHQRTLDGLTSDVLTTLTDDGAGRLARIEDRHGNALVMTRDASGNATQITAPFGQITSLAYDRAGWLTEITDPIGRKESFTYDAGGLLLQRADAGGGVHAMAYDELGRLTRDATAENASFTLSADGEARTTVTTGLGRREVHTFEAGAFRDEVRSYQAPDGTVLPWTLRRDGTATITYPDGTVVDVTREADPRLGMLVPYAAKHAVRLPSGLSRSVSKIWTVKVDAAGALAELCGESSTPDGRSSSVYEAAARVLTTTSPEGRVTKTTLDGQGRVAGGRVTRTAYDPARRREEPARVERDGRSRGAHAARQAAARDAVR